MAAPVDERHSAGTADALLLLPTSATLRLRYRIARRMEQSVEPSVGRLLLFRSSSRLEGRSGLPLRRLRRLLLDWRHQRVADCRIQLGAADASTVYVRAFHVR